MPRQIGIQRPLKLVAMVIGLITTLTGLFHAIAIGELRYPFGVVKISMKSALIP